ncbi:MAG TPA: ADP-forming succinate--CoA ligase subunit beta, partial [Gammaproteobacteria bacterium]|nr:ADP-forming succinate--CoA ligase subunit beta [Gammaproteobacteria bacterium]
MKLHEYQSKELFAQYGIPVPRGHTAASGPEAVRAARDLGGGQWVVKAQVHAGGRGKAGGVQRVDSADAVESVTDALLTNPLVTAQSGPEGQPVNRVLIEATSSIERELYLAAVVDRARERLVFMASASGGMDIEAVAAENPQAILRQVVEPVAGLQAYQCRRIAFGLGLAGKQIGELTRIMTGLYRLFMDKDASLVEVNPLVTTDEGHLLALDAKVNLDDNALYRHETLAELADPTQEDEREHRAHQFGLNYVHLGGNIGCMVNGAGLAMATMDLIQLHGGEPANFLDVGGG